MVLFFIVDRWIHSPRDGVLHANKGRQLHFDLKVGPDLNLARA